MLITSNSDDFIAINAILGLYLAAIMTKDTFEKAYYAASAQGAFNPSFVKVGE